MEAEVIDAELVLPNYLSFKRIQMYEKYPKGQARGRHWKHLKQILQAENYQISGPDEPNYVNIESPPSMHPCKRICDITGFQAPYHDPRTNLRYANSEVFKIIRSLPNEYVQRYLALRNAAIVLNAILTRHPAEETQNHRQRRRTTATCDAGDEFNSEREMSLVDYASSSDDDVPEPSEEERNKNSKPQSPQLTHNRTQAEELKENKVKGSTKFGSSSSQRLENKQHSSQPSVDKLPDASLLLNAPTVSSDLMSASDHFSRVAAAQAENASRKRDSNGMVSSAVRSSKVPRGNLPHSRNVPETSGGMLLPPQISGRKNIVTEDISKLFLSQVKESKRVWGDLLHGIFIGSDLGFFRILL
ncbi:hypothetical protein VNO78_12663 [Psophocarpus tetragonolobus]|uniref:Vps72/YL1 C-terminal domain-containing protein n=1 Tax=Psophocarpus tetragonolobus TaxID=3891 RepID=A0AAN9SNC4_PSOTE